MGEMLMRIGVLIKKNDKRKVPWYKNESNL